MRVRKSRLKGRLPPKLAAPQGTHSKTERTQEVRPGTCPHHLPFRLEITALEIMELSKGCRNSHKGKEDTRRKKMFRLRWIAPLAALGAAVTYALHGDSLRR